MKIGGTSRLVVMDKPAVVSQWGKGKCWQLARLTADAPQSSQPVIIAWSNPKMQMRSTLEVRIFQCMAKIGVYAILRSVWQVQPVGGRFRGSAEEVAHATRRLSVYEQMMEPRSSWYVLRIPRGAFIGVPPRTDESSTGASDNRTKG